MQKRFRPVWVLGIAALAFTLTSEITAQCPDLQPGRQIGTIESDAITEASGLVASRQNPGVLWTHQDNGNDRRIFAVTETGRSLGTWTLDVPATTDQEDIDIGPGPVAGVDYIFLGDIGQNNSDRTTIRVIRAMEPAVAVSQNTPMQATIPAETITLQYPLGSAAPSHKDAETLLVDTNGDIYVITKRTTVGMVYRAAYPQSTTSTITLQLVGLLPWGGCTGGEISPDGSAVIVRNYSRAGIWTRDSGSNLWEAFSHPGCDVPLMSEPQGEAICFKPDTLGYFTVSEGSHQPIYYFAQSSACSSNASCDDGDPCTTDICVGGQCQHLPVVADLDGDVVPDCRDACPGTPYGEIVNSVGCSCEQLDPTGDDDGDGVTNCLDACAGTPPAIPVNSSGCSIIQGGPSVLSFQQGASDYAGTADTFLKQDESSITHGSLDYFEWDSADPTPFENMGLLRFDDLVGDGDRRIPPGSAIISAKLTLVAFDASDGQPAELHEVLMPWDENQVTWDSFVGSPEAPATNYDEEVSATAFIVTGAETIDVTTSVQRWASGERSNLGWVFLPNSGDGLGVRAREFGQTAQRPKLTVVFWPQHQDEDGDNAGSSDNASAPSPPIPESQPKPKDVPTNNPALIEGGVASAPVDGSQIETETLCGLGSWFGLTSSILGVGGFRAHRRRRSSRRIGYSY